MNIQKERDMFEETMLRMTDGSFNTTKNHLTGQYTFGVNQTLWAVWQAAKAQSVPEGFVLVEKSLIKTLHEELLDHEPDSFVVNRDICELWKQAND